MTHTWQETGRVEPHVEGSVKLFRYGNKDATYLRCCRCHQIGFRFMPRMVVYTWGDQPKQLDLFGMDCE